MKDSLNHVAAVATTMDQTGVVLHFVEVRFTTPTILSCFHWIHLSNRKLIQVFM